MGKWSINELDKEKTKQSISNEEARLDHCREERERLIRERDKFKNDTYVKDYYQKAQENQEIMNGMRDPMPQAGAVQQPLAPVPTEGITPNELAQPSQQAPEAQAVQ